MHEKVAALNSKKIESQKMHEKLSDQYLQSIKGHSPRSQARRIIKQILLHNQDRFES
jgi:hypothetical protein